MRAAIIKKTAAIILCLSILLPIIVGCTRKEESEARDSSVPEVQTEMDMTVCTDEERRSAIYRKAFNTFLPEEVVLRIGGEDVLWKDFFYWLLVSIEFYIENYGEISDWKASDGRTTAKEYIINEAVDVIRLHRAVRLKADEYGVTISDSDKSYLDSTKSNIIQQYGGRDKFLNELENSFMSEELYDSQNEISVLYYNLFRKLYGENGEKESNEKTAEFAERVGFIRIKHIMLYKIDDIGNELDNNTLENKKKQLESMLDELLAADDSVREELFDEKMHMYSEDEGLVNYPDGYCFILGNGELARELEEPASALVSGELCDEIIESNQGYHIIMRLDVPPDTFIDDYYTVRYYAAYAELEEIAKEWQNDIETEYTEKLSNLDFEKIFAGL